MFRIHAPSRKQDGERAVHAQLLAFMRSRSPRVLFPLRRRQSTQVINRFRYTPVACSELPKHTKQQRTSRPRTHTTHQGLKAHNTTNSIFKMPIVAPANNSQLARRPSPQFLIS